MSEIKKEEKEHKDEYECIIVLVGRRICTLGTENQYKGSFSYRSQDSFFNKLHKKLRHYKDHRVHAVNFPGDPYPIHIDATFTPIKEGLIINNPQRRLPKEQRKLFEDNGWEIVDSAQPAHNEPPPLCYSSTWLSMNVLILDPKTVCVEKSEVYQAEQLDKLGMEVVPVELRDAYAFGGGLHCCTADVYREGELKDYFPKQ